jgi:hypothetical protein
MTPEARANFERTLRGVLGTRFGGVWELERLDGPSLPADRELGRFASAADPRPLGDVVASSDKHAVKDRG